MRSIYRPPWRIDVTIRDGVRVPAGATVLARAIGRALDAAGAPTPASVGLILADDRELATLNKIYLGHAGPTDVLSFPLLPPESYPRHPGLPALRPGAAARRSGAAARRSGAPAPWPGAPVAEFALPPGRRPHLGDIVVSVERAVEQAVEGRGGHTGDVRWSPADELRLLVIHGTLHVCGWDHAEPAEESAMRALERRLLR